MNFCPSLGNYDHCGSGFNFHGSLVGSGLGTAFAFTHQDGFGDHLSDLRSPWVLQLILGASASEANFPEDHHTYFMVSTPGAAGKGAGVFFCGNWHHPILSVLAYFP